MHKIILDAPSNCLSHAFGAVVTITGTWNDLRFTIMVLVVLQNAIFYKYVIVKITRYHAMIAVKQGSNQAW